MEIVVSFLKYGFVIALGVEVVLILRALVVLAREKAQPTPAPTTPTEN